MAVLCWCDLVGVGDLVNQSAVSMVLSNYLVRGLWGNCELSCHNGVCFYFLLAYNIPVYVSSVICQD